MEFTYHLPPNLIFGCGAADQVGAETAKYGKRALLVTGHSSAKKSGLLDRAVASLQDAGVESVLFDRVAQNPLTTTVMDGAALGRAEGCDVVVALGGGSALDAAKAVALMCVADGNISDYVLQRRMPRPILPLIAVTTTCGTGSEGNGTAVLSDPETKDKRGMRSDFCMPAVSIVDPLLMKTLPGEILASVGFDALCHNMETLLSRKCQPFAAQLALRGMELAARCLPAVCGGSEEQGDWEGIALASTLGGMAIYSASVVAPHGLEHPASGLRDIAHGRGLAALTPAIYERSLDAAPETFETIARCLGGKAAADCPDAVRRFLERIDLNVTLSRQGVLEEDVEWMTENCFRVSKMMLQNHPCELTKEDVRAIYRAAL